MRLTRYTDYALRVLMYLAAHPERATPISAMASAYGISHHHLVKVVHGMVRGGLLESVRGRHGGVRLARAPQDIRLGAVIVDSEPDMQLVDCAQCRIAPICHLPAPLAQATHAFVNVLDGYTLADLMPPAPTLANALAKPLDGG